MSEREFGQDRRPDIDIHEERVQDISQELGRYYRGLFKIFPIEDVRNILPVANFPQEVWSLLGKIRTGSQNNAVRLDPHLSNVFAMLMRENAMISWEIVAQSPQIAFYATGDLVYAQEVRGILEEGKEVSG